MFLELIFDYITFTLHGIILSELMSDYNYITSFLWINNGMVLFNMVMYRPIICVTNHPRLSSRNKGPMRLDASRVSRGYRLLRSPVAWAECGDFAYATDVARNEYAGKLDRELMWCVDTDTLAKHMAETATNTDKLGEPTIGD